MTDSRPGPRVFIAFALVCLIGGSNFVLVKLGLRELAPFYSAGVRFVLASALLFAIVAISKVSLPRGRGLVGSVVFGLLNFFAAYAFVYWGAQEVPAALTGVIFGAMPLLTFGLALAHRLERFRGRALIGGVIALAGVAAAARVGDEMPSLIHLGAIIIATVGAAESSIVIKRYPEVHPFAINAVAMAVGGVLLLPLSVLSGESWVLPERTETWLSFLFLATIGSAALFILYVYVVQNWTASGASYQFVTFPVISAVMAFLILDEPLHLSLALGAVLVIVGTYVGALASTAKQDQPVPATRDA